MKKNFFRLGLLLNLLSIIIALVVIRKSLFLRWFGYGSLPHPVADEFTYVWQALSLKKNGLPVAWTLNSGVYQDKKFNPIAGKITGFGIETGDGVINLKKFKTNPVPLSAIKEIDYLKGLEQMLFVAPFFDHPPLGGVIYSLAIDKNVKEVEDVKATDFRKPALVLAALTAVLLFLFLSLIGHNLWVGTLAVIVYSTVPTYLLATRAAFLENAVPPFVLVHLILLFFYTKNFSKKFSSIFLILSGLFGGLAVLAKEPALGFSIGSLILLWKNKFDKKTIFLFLVSCSIPILAYFIWGLFLQPALFLDIFLTNASRTYFGAIKIVTMLETLRFKNFPTDGWWIWGLLSFVLISLKIKNKKILFLTLPLSTHLLVVFLLGSANYPWYWISAIPFFAGCSALMIWKIIKNPKLTTAMLFFFIPFSSSYYWGREALNIAPSINHYRVAILAFSLMLFLRLKFKKSKIFSFFWTLFMAWLIYKIVIFNQVFIPYLISHWGSLSLPNLPNY